MEAEPVKKKSPWKKPGLQIEIDEDPYPKEAHKIDPQGWDDEIDLGDIKTPMEEKKTEVVKGWPDEDEIDLSDLDEVPVEQPVEQPKKS